MQTNLKYLRLGRRAVVETVDTEPALRQRLRDFGLVPGTQVCCRYRTPAGSVTAVEFRGSVVALRTRDLEKIRVRC